MPPMPDVKPFYGIRFAPVGPLKELVCPPYDVISDEEQERLHRLSEYNAVRMELPFSTAGDKADRYRRAAAQFRTWIQKEVLVPDTHPSLYVYRQDYELPSGERGRVGGVIGALALEEFGTRAGVLPHERTMPGPIEDRLALMRECPVNISPIYAIYRGGGALAPYIDALGARPPDARFVDDANTLHRLWAISAPAEIEMMREALRAGPLVIADGHHRYETALAYHREHHGAPGGHGAVMCFCVDADVEGLVVYPFHRIVRTPVSKPVADVLLERFGGKPLRADESEAALAEADGDHPMVVTLPDQDVLIDVPDDEVYAAVGDRPVEWRGLDVVALHEVVLSALSTEAPGLTFTRDAADVRRAVQLGTADFGVLLRPPNATDVIDVARAGERMPQKASYFWPKAVTGLVFRSLR